MAKASGMPQGGLPSGRWKNGHQNQLLSAGMGLRQGHHDAHVADMGLHNLERNQVVVGTGPVVADSNSGAVNEAGCLALEEKWANTVQKQIEGQVPPTGGIAGTEPLGAGRAEWQVTMAIPPGDDAYLPAEHIGYLDWTPMTVAVGSSCDGPVMFHIARSPGSDKVLPVDGLAVQVKDVIVRQLTIVDFPLPPLSQVTSYKQNAQLSLADALEASPGLAADLDGSDCDSAFAGATAASELDGADSRWARFEEGFSSIASLPDDQGTLDLEMDVGSSSDRLGQEELVEVFITLDGKPTFRALMRASAPGNNSFTAVINGTMKLQQMEERYSGSTMKAVADQVAIGAAKIEAAPEAVDPLDKYTTKAKPKTKAEAAKERFKASFGNMKARRRDNHKKRLERHDLALASSFADPEVETTKEFVDFQLRRFNFLFWDSFSLLRAAFLKSHPFTKVFLKSWVRLQSMQHVYVTSIAFTGSLAIAAICFHFDIMSLAEEDAALPLANSTDTGLAAWETTTTMAPTQKQEYNESTKLAIIVIVAVVSIILGLFPAKLVLHYFRKPIYFEVMDAEAKKKLLKHWARADKLGNLLSFALLSIFIGLLLFFVVESNDDRENNFAVSAIIIIAWKFVLWPLVATLWTYSIVEVARTTATYDDLLESFVPYSTWDFTMFTANDAADQARQLATMRGCHSTSKYRQLVAAGQAPIEQAPAKESVLRMLATVLKERLRKMRSKKKVVVEAVGTS